MDTPGRADTGDGEAQEPSGSGQASLDAAAEGLEKSMASPPPP